eukprot:TRINITY_DN112001_c0_g1_i1.p1 TRINITY_DN112001_c0_g1~~TRINITY_DN112001_c0_g1_i1.p1  ORF type:complete len:353 (+),score=63.99 TRINITY_DN112001_c0_g1_i1:79-1137(+)
MVSLQREKLFAPLVVASAAALVAIGAWLGARAEKKRLKKKLLPQPLPSSNTTGQNREDRHNNRAFAPSAAALRALLSEGRIITMPCCYDGMTAKLVERLGFELTFMTGFGVSAARGYPDCQLVSFQEMIDSAFQICSSLRKICCIGDGDTGYGNCVNVKRTVRGYAQAGFAGVMIEDQVAPKRCGHTKGKAVIPRDEAIARVRAACDARDEGLRDICILARTDARRTHGIDEAIARCLAFIEAGADITFLEAPESVEEMRRYCKEVPGPKLANMLGGGQTPILPPAQLEEMGYAIAAYPITLLSAGLKAQMEALERLKSERSTEDLELDFETLKEIVGFNEYYREEDRYKTA